jgi:RNA polymerase sigma-70 factor (ECF subfamily)
VSPFIDAGSTKNNSSLGEGQKDNQAQSSTNSSMPDQLQRQRLEKDLIRRVCAGDRENYYELIRPYERSVYLAALALMRNEADAEDVAQESFLREFRALPTFRFEARFSTWPERIAVNEARMRLRHARVAKSEPLDEDQEEAKDYKPLLLSDWRETPLETLERKEVRTILNEVIMQLPAKYREVILARDIQHHSIAETAELLGITTSSVKTRLLRARLRLRDLVVPLLKNAQLIGRLPFQKAPKPW